MAGHDFKAWLEQEQRGAAPGSPCSSRDGLDDADLVAVVELSSLGEGSLLPAAGEGDDDDDALLAEKIALLQEENQRLRAKAPERGAAEAAPPQEVEEEPASSAAAELADGVAAYFKEREVAAYEVLAAQLAAERAAAERALLADVDSWVGAGGGRAQARSRASGAARALEAEEAALAALPRLSASKPSSLLEGASRVLQLLEAAAPHLDHPPTPKAGPPPSQAAELAAAMEVQAALLGASAATVAATVAGGAAAPAVTRFLKRIRALHPAARAALALAGLLAFVAAVYVGDFYNGDAEESRALSDEGIVFSGGHGHRRGGPDPALQAAAAALVAAGELGLAAALGSGGGGGGDGTTARRLLRTQG